MRPPSLERLRIEGQAFLEELSREYWLAGAGHRPHAELQAVYARHPAVVDDEALGVALEAFRNAPERSEELRGARLLLDWQVDARSARELASLEEREIAWEASAVIRLPDGGELPFQRASIEMANAPDRARRLEVERARSALVRAELAPLRRDRLARERAIVEALGLADGYLATWTLLADVDVRDLAAQCERFLADTQAMWDDVLPRALRAADVPPGEATRADALALFRARGFDAAFPAAEMEARVLDQVREMGIDPLAGGRIRIDTAEREGKRSRAFCAPVQVPEEVHLVLRPHGGQADWTTFLHELGHALHFAYMHPSLPMEYRWLGDNSITESYAMLFDHRMQDAGWLRRYSGLGKALPEFVRAAALQELHFLRRYCAKLLYEVELYGGGVPWEALPDRYVDRLTGATGFRYDGSDAFVDVDPRFYAARYLRAWQLQAVIAESLRDRHDEDWWRNPRAGPWLRDQLMAEGQRETAAELAERVAGRNLTFRPLVTQLEGILS